MKPLNVTAVLVCAYALCAALARGQDTDVEAYARLLVDHPAEASGDDDAVASSWIDLLEREPGHPLADAALALLEERFSSLAAPRAAAERLLRLDARGFAPPGRRALALAQARARAEFALLQELPAEFYPDLLARFFVLGPLPPLADPAGALAAPELFFDPGLEREHETLLGPARWRPAPRPGTARFIAPAITFYPRGGYVMTAACFDLAEGGPGWLEIDAGESGRLQPENTYDPSYAWSLNGSQPSLVDLFRADVPRVFRAFVPLRTGRNQLVLRSSLDAPVEFAIRVLGRDGLPCPGLTQTDDVRPLGEAQDAARVAEAAGPGLIGAEEFLAGMPERGPCAEALLGVLRFADRRQPEGMAHLRAALERAPEDLGLKALLARHVDGAGYLPATWRENRARQLAEEVLAAGALRLDMGLHLAAVFAEEDREEEAIALLQRLSDELPRQTKSLLLLANVYRELDMTAQAEAALFLAEERAPDSPAVLAALVQHYADVGQETRSLELRRGLVRAAGATPDRLEELAAVCAQKGLVAEAEDLYREAAARSSQPDDARDLAAFLLGQERCDEADACAARAAELSERWRADRDEALRTCADGAYGDSVVHVLRIAVIHVFPDGSLEALQHDVFQARDLEGCERLGTRKLSGDVLKIVTIKARDNSEYEPVRVDGEYVMPALEPGDYVETVSRVLFDRPRDGVLRINALSLATTEQPVHRCRFVLSLPKALPLRLVLRNFAGRHETSDSGDALVHVLEVENQKRVLPEPGTPPWTWFLPWFRIGVDRALDASLAQLALETLLPARVTPEIEEAAAAALAGVAGEEARARALHALVNDTLDQRWPDWSASATHALLAREGNPNTLYAALLAAAGIEHDLIWSRDFMPGGDPEPDPPFLDADHWKRKLYVRVRPADGPVAWCDLSERTMPYGVLFGDAPAAPAFAVRSGERLQLPDLPLQDLPGFHLHMTLRPDAEGGAGVDGGVRFPDGLSYFLKRQIREIPATQRKFLAVSLSSQILPGIDVKEFAIAGLEDDAPLSGTVAGAVPAFLDDDGQRLSCRLPIKALELSARFGGEGERRLPFFLSGPLVQSTEARIELPEGLELVDPPAELRRSFRGGSYLLSVTPAGERAWLVRHEIALPPLSITAQEFPEFRALCAEVDEAERALLRFRRA
ncbi:MAG: hypothetical protein HY812_09580 [Planctomycetes bacterium]|nr:hypothetical protein [Planctomycetota bacterium]